MGRPYVFFALAFAAASLVFGASQSRAQSTLTFVSATGSDASANCTPVAPCATFATALTKTNNGGTITCLNSGAFGKVTITKTVMIDCEGSTANAISGATNSIVIDGAGVEVILKGLNLDGGDGINAQNGIRFLNGAALHVDGLTIHDFNAASPNGNGILFAPSAGISKLVVTNSHILSNGSSGAGGGIVFAPTGGANVVAVITNSVIDNNTVGIRLPTTGTVGNLTLDNTTISNSAGHAIEIASSAGTTKLTIQHSNLVNNGGNGIMLAPTGGAKVNTAVVDSALDGNVIGVRSFPAIPAVSNLTISDTSASNNVGGIHASGKSTVGIIRATVSGNSSYGVTGISPAAVRIGSSIVNGNTLGFSGPVDSYGNNQLLGNTTLGSSTPVAPGGAP